MAKLAGPFRSFFSAGSSAISYALGLTALAGALSACTGTSGSSPAKVSLSLPTTITENTASGLNGKDGNSTELTAKHFVISVSGGDLAAPVVLTWDSCDSCSVPAPAPSYFELEVSKGSHLVQVLGVYGGSANGAYLYYGDKQATLTAGSTNPVDIQIAKQLAFSSLTSGTVSGRYIAPVRYPLGGGPTGKLNVLWTPADASKPKMRIMSGSIVAGWFNAFGLKDVPLNYVTDDGLDLFDGVAVSLSSIPTNTKVMRIDAPASVTKSSSASATPNNHDAKTFVIGFFGTSLSRRVCFANPANYPSISATLDASGTNPLTYGTSSASLVQVSGGQACTDLKNTTGDENESYLAFRPSVLNGKGSGDTGTNFQSIFAGDSDDDVDAKVSAIQITRAPASTDAIARYRILPGIDSTVVKGVRVFKRVSVDNSNSFNSETPCDALVAGKITGFNQINDVPVPTPWSNATQEVRLPIAAAEVGHADFAFCPYKALKNYDGIYLSQGNFPYGSGGTPGLVIAAGTASPSFMNLIVGANTCVPILIYEQGANGPVTRAADTTVNLTSTLSGGGPMSLAFYSDSSCTVTSTGSAVTILKGNSNASVYFKLNSGAQNGSIQASIGSLVSNALPVVNPGMTPFPQVPTLAVTQSSYEGQCSAYELYLTDWLTKTISQPPYSAVSTVISLVSDSVPTAELRNSCGVASTPSLTGSVALTYGLAGTGNVTKQIYLRMLDPSRETEVKSVTDSVPRYSVLNPELRLSNSAQPRAWFQPKPRYLTSVVSGGGELSLSGWMSRVNGFQLDYQSGVALANENNAPVINANPGYFSTSGLGSSSFSTNSPISGLILLRPSQTNSMSLFMLAASGGSPAAGTAHGFELSFTSDLHLIGSLSSTTGAVSDSTAATASPTGGNATLPQVIRFKWVRSPNTDKLMFAINNGPWVTKSASWATLPNPSSFLQLGSSLFKGSIYEVILFDQDLPDQQFTEAYTYLKTKYPGAALP